MRCVLKADEGAGTAIVYVPGIDGTGELLLGTAERLSARHRLLRLGHVADDPPNQDSYEKLARSVIEVLDGTGIERALLLAESFGGGVALQAALDNPQRIAGLALVNTFAHYRRRIRLRLARCFAPLVPRFAFDRGRAWVAPWALFGRRPDPDAVRRFRAQPGTWFDRGYRRRLRLLETLDLRSRLPEVRPPVALFVGDADRVVDSARQAEQMARGLADVTVEVIRGGGHLILPLAELPWPGWMDGLAARAALT